MTRLNQSVEDYTTRTVFVSCTCKTTELGEPHNEVQMSFKDANKFVDGFSKGTRAISKSTLVKDRTQVIARMVSKNYFQTCMIRLNQ